MIVVIELQSHRKSVAISSYSFRKMYLSSHSKEDVFSKAEYIEFFEKRTSKITAQKNDIQSMLNFGLCEKIGNGPSTKYRIN